MKLRSTQIDECWCSNCNSGMMEKILDISFERKKHYTSLIGEKITCPKCGYDNILEDVLIVKPQMYFLLSAKDGVAKTNDELAQFLRS